MRPPLALLLATALAGCDALAPGDAPFTEVDAAPAPFTVDLAAAADTVGLWGTAQLSYWVQGGPVRRVEVLLDGAVVAARSGAGLVPVPTADRADGTYALVFRAYGSTGTGSLADKLERETVLAEVERVAVVDNRPPSPVDVVSARPEGGLLNVRWDPYRRHNFQAYAPSWAAGERIRDRRQTTWADPTYLGGERSYTVLVEAGSRAVAGAPLTVDYPAPALAEAVHEGNGRLRIAWHATPFTGAFKSYALFREMQHYDRALVKTTGAAADTVAVDQVEDVFGRPHEYLLRTVGRAPNTDVFSRFAVYTDPPSPLGGRVHGVPGGALLGVDVETRRLALRDARTLALRAAASLPEGALVYGYAASPSGRVGVLAGWGGRAYALELNGTTLQTVHQTDVTTWAGRDPQYWDHREGRAFFTDDGVLVFGVQDYRDFDAPTVVAVDVATGQRVGWIAGPRRELPIAASGDGRFVVTGRAGGNLYERDAASPSGYRLLGAVSHEFGVYGAAFLSPTRLAIVTTSPSTSGVSVDVLAVPSLERVARIPIGEWGGTEPPIAVEGDRVAVHLDDAVHVLDARAGAEVVRFASSPLEQLSLAGGAVWGAGRYRRLP